jgi:hypothetical protein
MTSAEREMGHGGQCFHGAGRDHHALGLVGAAGDAGADVAHRMHHMRERLDLLAVHVEFLVQAENARIRHHQVGLDGRQRAQHLQ